MFLLSLNASLQDLVIPAPVSNRDGPPESVLLAVLAGLLLYFVMDDPDSELARLERQLLEPLEPNLLLEYPVSVEVV